MECKAPQGSKVKNRDKACGIPEGRRRGNTSALAFSVWSRGQRFEPSCFQLKDNILETFDAFTTFLLKCGVIPPWEVKLRAFQFANNVWDDGGAPKVPILPKDTREIWVERNWRTYVDLARSMIKIHRPRW